MSIYDKITDNIEVKGFISKESILNKVSEQDIFAYVFGFEPIEFEYIISPFRDDTNPGCWFELDANTLRFVDYADNLKIDCFDAIKLKYNLKNFYETLAFINKNIIKNKNFVIKPVVKKVKKVNVIKKDFKILIATRNFSKIDGLYWTPYEITKQNLIDDKVFPIQKFKLLNTRKGDITVRPIDLCYCYTDFKDNKKKIYRPEQKVKKFITNCDNNDIGGINFIDNNSDNIIITKSYKDYRVLKNLNLNVIWFQNEGMFPDKEILKNLLNSFNKIIIFFDNDKAGIKASIKLYDLLISLGINNIEKIWLNENLLKDKISDASDLIENKGKQNLIDFLRDKNINLL
jgi:hypothetical protein